MKLVCGNCRTHFDYEPRKIGRQDNCPKCEKLITESDEQHRIAFEMADPIPPEQDHEFTVEEFGPDYLYDYFRYYEED